MLQYLQPSLKEQLIAVQIVMPPPPQVSANESVYGEVRLGN